jgi:hypothetical protein
MIRLIANLALLAIVMVSAAVCIYNGDIEQAWFFILFMNVIGLHFRMDMEKR